MKIRRYVNTADLVRQLESLAEERITDTTSWRWGSQKILHPSKSKAALASADKSLFNVSFRKQKYFSDMGFMIPNQIDIMMQTKY
jgi:hypothetical protein